MKFSYLKLASMSNEEAREYLEKIRWPYGPACPHCGSVEYYTLNPRSSSNKPCRKGLYKCKDCKKQYSVTVGTIFHGSHVKLGIWLAVVHLMCSSKKGVSAHQVHRLFGVTYKTAWHMLHRIRFAVGQEPMAQKLQGIVECDETYIGGRARGKRGRGAAKKTPVFALVQRDGTVRSQKVESVSAKNLKDIIYNNVDPLAIICTDDFRSYLGLDKDYSDHYIIQHSKGKYAEGINHTNTIEGFFSLLKRGINGTFHHVSKKHLNLYLNEFNFRYNNRKITDIERTLNALASVEGKRLMYRDSSRA